MKTKTRRITGLYSRNNSEENINAAKKTSRETQGRQAVVLDIEHPTWK